MYDLLQNDVLYTMNYGGFQNYGEFQKFHHVDIQRIKFWLSVHQGQPSHRTTKNIDAVVVQWTIIISSQNSGCSLRVVLFIPSTDNQKHGQWTDNHKL